MVPVPEIRSNTILDLDLGAWSLHKLSEGLLAAAAGGSGQKGFKVSTRVVERAASELFERIDFFLPSSSMAATHFHEQLCRSGGVERGLTGLFLAYQNSRFGVINPVRTGGRGGQLLDSGNADFVLRSTQ